MVRKIGDISKNIKGGLSGLETMDEQAISKVEPKAAGETKNKKRSFMLADEQIDKLDELRFHFRKIDRQSNKDLSEIVREAIDRYYSEVIGEKR